MNVTVSWDNDARTVIRYDFEKQWTWDEFYAAATSAFAMTRSVSHLVDTISNFTPGAALPPNALFQFRRAMYTAPANRGVNVIVGASALIKTLVLLFSQLNRDLSERLILVDSLEQAREVLAERRKL